MKMTGISNVVVAGTCLARKHLCTQQIFRGKPKDQSDKEKFSFSSVLACLALRLKVSKGLNLHLKINKIVSGQMETKNWQQIVSWMILELGSKNENDWDF